MRKFIFLIFLFQISWVHAQDTFRLKGQIKNLPNQSVYLLDFYGIENSLVDSTNANSAGFFSFTFDADIPVGLFRLVVGGRSWDFIYNKENIELYSDYNFLIDSMKIIESVENKLLNEYLLFLKSIDNKINELQKLKNLYVTNDSFFEEIEEEENNLETIIPRDYVNNLIKDNQHTFVARFLKTEQFPAINDSIANEKRIEYITEHMFDNVDFTDTALINSPVYIQKVRTYFSLINNIGDFDEVEQAYIVALNKLMSKAAVNDKVFNFILEDISNGFEQSDYELFFAYLTENYLLESSCKNEEENKELKERLDDFKRLANGNKAPEIDIILEDSSRLILSEMEANYKLIIFWAGWCGHCKIILPEIKKLYDEYKNSGFEIIAISLDNENYEWKNAIEEGNYDWINYSELSGWDCPAAIDYGITATPTLYLLDKNNTIILKPRTADQLRRKLSQLL
ncbi:thioredoxin-like domain-containing protein [Bacteroidota bacterium]